jgi:Holliday junction resolvasome RuvABC endonuclease subunit
MASYGVCIGVLAACPGGVIEVTPTEVKVAATGHKTATKEEMIDWAFSKFPNAQWLVRKTNGDSVLKKENEHLADAIGAINAGLRTKQWEQLRNVLLIYNH